MRTPPRSSLARGLAGLALVAAVATACGGSGGGSGGAPAGDNGTPIPVSRGEAATPGSGGPTVGVSSTTDLGSVLATGDGWTLYRFDADRGGHSSCTGSCTATWPPLLLPKGASAPTSGTGVPSGLGVVDRAGGGKQVVFRGSPLYRYAGDRTPGTANGDDVDGTWHAVTLGGGPSAAPVPSNGTGDGGGGAY